MNATTHTTGATALHLALKADNFQTNISGVVQALLQAGADVKAQDSFGKTALHDAAVKRRQDEVRLLLQHGANVMATDVHGNTALHLVAQDSYPSCGRINFGRSMDMMHCLLCNGAPTSRRNAHGAIPLQLACEKSNVMTKSHCSLSETQRIQLGIPKTCLDSVFVLLQASVQEGSIGLTVVTKQVRSNERNDC